MTVGRLFQNNLYVFIRRLRRSLGLFVDASVCSTYANGMKLISKILIAALALLLTAYLVPGIEVDTVYIAIIAAFILGVLNLIARPILIILTLPITVLTLGLFIFVINALIFLFVASFVDGFNVDGFLVALVGSLLVSVISSVGNKFI